MDLEKIIKNIKSDWNTILLQPEFKKYITPIQELLKKEHEIYVPDIQIFPHQNLIFKAFEYCNLNDIRVVIMGQDCYHAPGQAMGLCFSVPKDKRIPPSLRNIYKELHNDIGFEIPSHGDLTPWAKQGVLLLNSALTVRQSSPMSHMKVWKPFTDSIISYISKNSSKPIVFMLWGNSSKSKQKFIDKRHKILTSHHPSPLSANRGGWFGCKHFSKCNDFLQTIGEKKINWDL